LSVIIEGNRSLLLRAVEIERQFARDGKAIGGDVGHDADRPRRLSIVSVGKLADRGGEL
jgi:hypothetical protein